MISLSYHIQQLRRSIARRISSLGAALLVSVALTGCFTGVESTPKITDADVRRGTTATRPEEKYLDDVRREPFGAWQPGKAFIVTDPKIALVLNNRAVGSGPVTGSRLFYKGAVASRDITGSPTTLLELTDSAHNEYIYTVSQSLDSLTGKRPELPFTIDMAMVESVAARLEGNTYWVMTPVWRDDRGQTMQVRKYVPVKVTHVRPGTTVYPIAVEIEAVTDSCRGILMLNPDRRGRNNHSFAQLFSLSDPRLNHPGITDSVWKNIIEGKVTPGMTREECRLAVGAPVEVIRQPGYSYLHEAWRYDTGLYLIFMDGVLQSIKR